MSKTKQHVVSEYLEGGGGGDVYRITPHVSSLLADIVGVPVKNSIRVPFPPDKESIRG